MTCHPINPSNPLGTDNRFHNVGVSARHQDFEGLAKRALKAMEEDPSEQKLDELALSTDMSELGRFMVTKNRSDICFAINGSLSQTPTNSAPVMRWICIAC